MGSNRNSPIRIALVGAGVFARDAHLPSLLRLGHLFEIVAIFSRTKTSATALAEQVPYPVEIFTDPADMLARDDIEAFDVVLPIGLVPSLLPQLFATGKHVLSEKPIGPDVQAGLDLMAEQARHTSSVWMVGENWRYEDAFLRAADLVRQEAIGKPLTFQWAIYTPMNSSNKYYNSEWRRDRSVPGGLLQDGGVHHIAALRLMLGEIDQVCAIAAQHSARFPPADTIASTLHFDSGVVGTYMATYSTGAPWSPYLHIAGTEGTLQVQRGEVVISSGGETQRLLCDGFDGVQKELAAFATSVRSDVPHRNLPGEALQDLAVLEALLRSAREHRLVQPLRYA